MRMRFAPYYLLRPIRLEPDLLVSTISNVVETSRSGSKRIGRTDSVAETSTE